MDILSLNVLLGMPLPLCSLKMFEVAGGNPLGATIFSMLALVFSWVTMSMVAGNSTLPLTWSACVGIDQSDARLVSQFLNLVENRLAPARILRVHHGDAIGHDEYRSIAATPFEYE